MLNEAVRANRKVGRHARSSAADRRRFIISTSVRTRTALGRDDLYHHTADRRSYIGDEQSRQRFRTGEQRGDPNGRRPHVGVQCLGPLSARLFLSLSGR